MLYRVFFDQIMYRFVKVLRLFQHVARFGKRFGNDCIEHDVRLCHRILGACHTELKLVAGKRKRRGAVSVCRVFTKIRQRLHACLKHLALDRMRRHTGADELGDHVF